MREEALPVTDSCPIGLELMIGSTRLGGYREADAVCLRSGSAVGPYLTR